MDFSDSDEDDFGLPAKSKVGQKSSQQQQRWSSEDEQEDSTDDLFQPPKRPQQQQAAEESTGDGYVPPPRDHVCDECEGVFREAVFCGECSMTYCLACDARYHSSGDEIGLRSHFRQPLHGEVPRAIARQMHELAREDEENEAEDQREQMARQSIYSSRGTQEERDQREADQKRQEAQQAAEREANMPLAPSLNSEYAGGYAAGGAPPPAAAMDQYSNLSHSRTVSFHNDYTGHGAHLRGSPPPPAAAAASSSEWSTQHQDWNPSAAAALAAAYPVQEAYAAQAMTQQGWSGTQARPYATTVPRAQGQTTKLRRPASATPVGHVPRTTMVLKSTRPPSAATAAAGLSSTSSRLRASPSARSIPTTTTTSTGGGGASKSQEIRMSVSNPTFTSLAGKARFGRNMLLHSSSAAMVHQLLPGRKASTKGEKGAHSSSTAAASGSASNAGARWGDLDRSAPMLREMNDEIMRWKMECAATAKEKDRYKTAVLKKQRALKEIARIAINLAKQPNVSGSTMTNGTHSRSSSLNPSSGSSGGLSTVVHGPAELQEKLRASRTTNEILRLEVDQLQAKLTVLRDTQHARTVGVRELGQLERERRALVKQVSIDAAARELDAFKQAQMVADLEFAVGEMRKAVDEKKRQAADTKMHRMATENAVRALQHEYEVAQQKLDRASARAVAGHYDEQ